MRQGKEAKERTERQGRERGRPEGFVSSSEEEM